VTVDVELNGERRTVEVRRAGDYWEVLLDGRRLAVSVAEAGDRWSLLIRPAEGPAEAGHYEESPVVSAVAGPPKLGTSEGGRRTSRSHEISFEPRAGGEQVVHVDGTPVPVTVVDPRALARRRGRHGGAHGEAGAPLVIVAPMPGRIVKVLVKPGDTVAARQGVIVVEAMKMENELRAVRPGTVTAVRVSEGMSVDAQAILVVLE
jgi:biotin carboxyl carrier protein